MGKEIEDEFDNGARNAEDFVFRQPRPIFSLRPNPNMIYYPHGP